jgi:hypothetical protein
VLAGFYRNGLPFGLEISARRRRDVDMLGCAYAIEQATHRRPPSRAGQSRPAPASSPSVDGACSFDVAPVSDPATVSTTSPAPAVFGIGLKPEPITGAIESFGIARNPSTILEKNSTS